MSLDRIYQLTAEGPLAVRNAFPQQVGNIVYKSQIVLDRVIESGSSAAFYGFREAMFPELALVRLLMC